MINFDARVDDFLELVGNNIYDIDEQSPPAWNPPDIITRIDNRRYIGIIPPIAITWSINPDPNIPLTITDRIF